MNTSRQESERLIDILYKPTNLTKKPRTYRRVALSEWLSFSKKKKKSRKEIRKFIGKQFNYLSRNLGHITFVLDQVELLQSEVENDLGVKSVFPHKLGHIKN